MKKFKIVSIFFALLGGLFLFTGCTSSNVEGTLEEIMTKIYSDIPEDQRPMMLGNMEVTEENVEGFLGTSDIEYKEALASESMVGAIAHSVVLVRAKEGADIEAVKTTIKENVNPRKWVCVGVEKDDIIVENEGDLIILIMVEDEATREKLEDAFDNLK